MYRKEVNLLYMPPFVCGLVVGVVGTMIVIVTLALLYSDKTKEKK